MNVVCYVGIVVFVCLSVVDDVVEMVLMKV